MVADAAVPAIYRIALQEDLGSECCEWFGGFAITRDGGGWTCLTGLVADQAELHDLIRNIADLGLTLLSLERVDM